MIAEDYMNNKECDLSLRHLNLITTSSFPISTNQIKEKIKKEIKEKKEEIKSFKEIIKNENENRENEIASHNKEETRDYRHPLYLGDWSRSLAWRDDQFAMDKMDDPHFKRKRVIIQAHPEIATLYKPDLNTKFIICLAVLCQILIAINASKMNWWQFLLVSYAIGGSMSNILGVAIHECTHNLVDYHPLMNRIYGLIANIVIPVPISMSFKRYHLEHHTFQGVGGMDPDLPMEWELKLIRGGCIEKILWMCMYPAMYAIRGAAFGRYLSRWECYNIIWTIFTNTIFFLIGGWKSLFYMAVSLWLGYSFHPAAAHFIQEHYTFVSGQETYSYYGWANLLFLNIGYHNEHHDFPQVPWSLLPKVKEMAGEFYDPLIAHYSWINVLWQMMFNPDLGPQSRCVRDIKEYRKARKIRG